MRRLTITGKACVEILALLVTVAWADERLDDAEKEGVRGAAKVLNLTKEMRDRLELVLEKPMPLDSLYYDDLSARDREFAYVAAAWMAGADEEMHEKEEALLDQLGKHLGLSAVRKGELEAIARNMPRERERAWSEEVTGLFKTIATRLAPAPSTDDDEIEVVIEP